MGSRGIEEPATQIERRDPSYGRAASTLDPASPTGAPAAFFRPVPRRASGLIALCLVAAAADAYVFAFRYLSALPNRSLILTLPVLAALFALADLAEVQLTYRGQAHRVDLRAVPLVMGLLFATPSVLILAQLAGTFVAVGLPRRRPAEGRAYAIARRTLETELAALVFHGGLDGHTPLGWPLWSAATLASVTACLTGVVTTRAYHALSGRARVERMGLAQDAAVQLIGAFTAGNLAVIVGDAISVNRSMVLPLTVLAAVLFVAYRALLAERSRRTGLEFMYRVSNITHGSSNYDHMLVDLLEETRSTFDAGVAEVIVFTDDMPAHEHFVRTTVGLRPDPDLLTTGPSGLSRAAVVAAMQSSSSVVGFGPDGAGTSMVVRLTGDKRELGVLVVSDPRRSAASFAPERLRLLETLANHLSLILENGHLERSITQLHELEREMTYKVLHDPLTSLPNRVNLRGRLQDLLDAGRVPALLLIDLDDFKTINDTLGHAVGDRLLAAMGERLRRCCRQEAMAARLGGDEFAVLLEDGDLAEAIRMTNRVMSSLSREVSVGDRSVTLTPSIGVVVHDGEATDADGLLRDADIAMYRAKGNGKDRYEVFERKMSEEVVARHRLKEDLFRAAEQQQFENHYQPMVDLRTNAVVAVESLVRWNHPWAGMVSPDEFIPLAEETGTIISMGRQVLASACRDGAAWRFLQPDLAVSVNVSVRQLDNDSLIDDVRQVLAESGFPAGSLILEITETATMSDLEAMIGRLQEIKALGVRIAMDDFGTGYSSLAQIRRLPIDILKIPKPFIDNIADGGDGLETVRAITALSESLGLEVVAEGIERSDQFESLQELACAKGQGYLFGRPVPAHDMTRMLAAAANAARPMSA